MAYENEDYGKHLDSILEKAELIKPGLITILTGPNGYGKSLIRKVLLQELRSHGYEGKVASFSMERRTTPNANFGALSSLAIDRGDDATSNHTCHMTLGVLGETDKYIVLDEPEIGMGKEALLGLVHRIKTTVEEMKAAGTFKGLLVITHSEYFIEQFPHDTFVNLEGLSYEEWKNREVKPIDPDKLAAWCHGLWQTIQSRTSKNG